MNQVQKITSATSLTWPVTAALRALAIDAVEAAKSGHPGAPMGMAEIAAVLWRQHLRHDPADPTWPDRDRFVLSNGHASMLIYGLLHLTGYDLPLSELKRFRQMHAKTPGHPEVGVTVGVETTTGPLGQGFANAVGMAIAEKTLAAQFNRPGHTVVDHRTFVFLGDGCLMEGISHEAASLAGRLGLGKLVALYDDNGISIDGKVEEWFADDTPARFEAYGWHVVRDVDGHDPAAIDAAITVALGVGKPSLICCKTVIGRGAPTKQGTENSHGAPLGPDEAAKAKAAFGWSHPPFVVPDDVYAQWNQRARGAGLHADWTQRFEAYRAAFPELAAEFERRINGDLPATFPAATAHALAEAKAAGNVASRKAGQVALSAYAPDLPELLGGSADLTHSNLTNFKGSTPITRDAAGNTILFGVREFGMSAIANGIALHGGFIPFVATFLVFSDYARNAIRMSALMGQRVVYVFTHDSIALGEDGPTHQPVEHVESLRLIPNLDVWRPADAVETAFAWRAALVRKDGPTAIVLSRQTLPAQPREAATEAAIANGGYVLSEPAAKPAAVLVATGSEVALATAARDLLAADNIAVRVVSMPCREAFERLGTAEQATVIDRAIPHVAVEAGVTRGWRAVVGFGGDVVGLDRFGESAPEKDLLAHFGFTPQRIADTVKALLAR
ncbi:transketolase [Blastochloris viridis]|uniref:Transketolase n=1 Tax=Blastochloris viridis TaxID=1079 RepID=A0A0H5BB68_BLAVI|nr:transketolase [Blastochloris viridis]ALK08379.1 Transketolase 1 [Blastochloris viridis]BAR98349.1 transketolase [Blastochloris viridis]CUU41041.1 Transketolase 1 [Blastochloris viridis]